tara:strand:+ start:172 stop:402 length:231 start_codon:yes stop_codon:yes gene_type:complete
MWWQIAVNLAFVVLATALYRPPSGPQARTVNDLGVPKANEGDPIVDIAGTAWIDNAHVVWYGDFASKGVYKKGGKK